VKWNPRADAEPCASALGKARDLFGKAQSALFETDRGDAYLSGAEKELRGCVSPSCPSLVREPCAALADKVAIARSHLPPEGCVPSALPGVEAPAGPSQSRTLLALAPPGPARGHWGDVIVLGLLLLTMTFVGAICVGAVRVYRRLTRR
jgi:hypothetical protein